MKYEPTENQTCTFTEADILSWIEAKVDQLHAEARVLVDDYWRRLKGGQKQQAADGKARIGVRIRRREASLSFSIECFRMAMIRQNGQAKPIAQYLKKGASYRYPLGNFLKGEPQELETEFADIRKQLGLLGKIRDAVQDYRKNIQS